MKSKGWGSVPILHLQFISWFVGAGEIAKRLRVHTALPEDTHTPQTFYKEETVVDIN